ncbi:MAG: cellulose biosynthesis protein BcsG [Elusimicrobia bacterium]|nr:cellulose biosynthesis protein BcsG [Elusimicrobiota bacterium]
MIAWLWAAYFAVKLWLNFKGVIAIHFWPNLALLALAMPYAPSRGPEGVKKSMLVRQCLAVPLGAALFWYDSYLPPFIYSMKFLLANRSLVFNGFSGEFLAGLAAKETSFIALAALLALFLFAAKKKLHPTPIVFLALMLVFVKSLRGGGRGVPADLQRFYAQQAKEWVPFPSGTVSSPPFDIVFIHICSLAWDDLKVIHETNPQFLDDANIVFTDFNSATSYSAPAALRLSRAPCGQVAHDALYRPWPPQCDLWTQLRVAGYRTYAQLNTAPAYYGMAAELKKYAGLDWPGKVDGLPVQMLSFDGQPVYANKPVLDRWLAKRQQDGEPRAALFYNTITLHTGGHEDVSDWWKEPALDEYSQAFSSLDRDLVAFEYELARDGRSTAVVIVPEHGAALRGTRIQAAQLRDIPLPRITEVPVAVRFIGPLFRNAPAKITVPAPSSYLALAKLLSDLISDPGLASRPGALAAEAGSLPATGYLSETQNWKVFMDKGQYYLLSKDGDWRTLPREDVPVKGQMP